MCVSNTGQQLASVAGTGMGLAAVAGMYFLMGRLRRHASAVLTGAGWLAVAQVVGIQVMMLLAYRDALTNPLTSSLPGMWLLLFSIPTYLLGLVAAIAFVQHKHGAPYLRAFLALMVHAVAAFWLGTWCVGNEANFRNLLGTSWEPYRPISTAFCYTLIVVIPLGEMLRPFFTRRSLTSG